MQPNFEDIETPTALQQVPDFLREYMWNEDILHAKPCVLLPLLKLRCMSYVFIWQCSENSNMSCTEHKQPNHSVCEFWPQNHPLISKDAMQAEKCQFTTNTMSAMMKTMAEISLNSEKQFSS